MNQKGFAGFAIIILIVVILFAVFVYVLQVSQNLGTHPISQASSLPSAHQDPDQIQKNGADNFFLFGVPRPLADLNIYKLPNDSYIRNAVQVKDSIWFAGSGSLIEFDTKTSKIVSYSDYTQANCDSNVIYVNNYLYTSCRTDNIDDASGPANKLTTPIYTGHYSIFKIDPSMHQVLHRYDSLQNRYNYNLVSDGDTVWVETFGGIGKIDTKTDKTDFYPQSQIGIHFGSGNIFPDKDYVWVYSIDDGMALFDRAQQSWRKFRAAEVIGIPNYQNSLDTRPFNNGAKLVDGGIQVGILDQAKDQDNCLIRKYSYDSKSWSTTNSWVTKTITECEDTLKPFFDKIPEYSTVDSNGLTQLKLPTSDQVYDLGGRNNYVLSSMVGDKRYILTNSTIDVLDETSPFRQILVRLGSDIVEGRASDPSTISALMNFLVDSETELSVVVSSSCFGEGCSGGPKVWLIDLKAGKILKNYTLPSAIDIDQRLTALMMLKQGNNLLIKDKNNKDLFSIDITSYSLTLSK